MTETITRPQCGPAEKEFLIIDSCTLANAVDGEGKPIRFKKDIAKAAAFAAEARRAEKDIGNK